MYNHCNVQLIRFLDLKKMSEYCEFMWDPTRSYVDLAMPRTINDEETRMEAKDKKLAIEMVRTILRGMPEVGE